ncbi:unnamed protein product [Miscanthus lutarioriparius]|uniref:Uncharacterized protein n=1 Tax=Miscanthus lutarioriparius TaxID=422564 RepID=A0A811MMH6_9POAL|nr:unnamed protein product [Miscanthus lutarioriparius]
MAKFLRRHGLHLLATTSTWFLLDIAFYSQNLFQKDIFTKVGWILPARTMNAIEEVYRISARPGADRALWHHPGYWFTVGPIDVVGRFWIQIMGFFMMTVFMLALGARLRSTCHGISAAAGKAGAIIGAFGFLYAAQDPKKPDKGTRRASASATRSFVLAGTNFLGMLMSLFVPESKGKSLEEISKENVDEEAEAKV